MAKSNICRGRPRLSSFKSKRGVYPNCELARGKDADTNEWSSMIVNLFFRFIYFLVYPLSAFVNCTDDIYSPRASRSYPRTDAASRIIMPRFTLSNGENKNAGALSVCLHIPAPIDDVSVALHPLCRLAPERGYWRFYGLQCELCGYARKRPKSASMILCNVLFAIHYTNEQQKQKDFFLSGGVGDCYRRQVFVWRTWCYYMSKAKRKLCYLLLSKLGGFFGYTKLILLYEYNIRIPLLYLLSAPSIKKGALIFFTY